MTMQPDMTEATRLVRGGRLAEATALIQRLLGGAPEPARPVSPSVIDAEAVTVEGTGTQPRMEQPPRLASRTIRAGAFGAGEFAGKARSRLRDVLSGLAGRSAPAVSTPGEPLPEGASFLAASYTNAAGTRSYKLYVPSGRAGQALPLVVMLHGCTQSPDDFAAGTRMNTLAEERGCLVAYPAQCSSANSSKCWNWFSPEHQQRDRGEASLIAGITRQIMRDHHVDASRVYIAGLSAGGAAAAIMAATYPDLYAAVGVHSGLAPGAARDLPSAFAAMRQGGAPTQSPRHRASVIPTIVFHGDQDNTVHPRNGDAVIAHAGPSAEKLRATVQRGQVPGGHAYSRILHADSSARVLCEQWTIHGAGHAWAGGSAAGSYTDPRGPDATREMLRFFLEHAQPAAGG